MSVFEHPWLSGLFGDDEVQDLWSAKSQLSHMLAFEAAWSRNGHVAGLWEKGEGEQAAANIESMRLDPTLLAEGTGRDGVCVPDLVRLLKAEAGDAVHRGATSQDVIDSSLSLTMVATCDLVENRLHALREGLIDLQRRVGSQRCMGRTRMQAAQEITFGDRIQTWRLPLEAFLRATDELRLALALVQIGGPAGNRASLGGGADAMVAAVASDLGLGTTERAWHVRREGVADFANALAKISGTLGKMGQDIALMAQMGEISVDGAGGSSAMAHKQNPVLAELLVTLARFNATQVSGVHHSLVHEQERSGAAWALEWMVLPEMAKATGRATAAAISLIASVRTTS